jgi:Asp-tRNA(Asn)/Glu-tRNA(Gln) amidotransferase B subunit
MLAPGTTKLYGTWIPRSVKHAPKGITKIVSFGQQLVWKWLHDEFEENFFFTKIKKQLDLGLKENKERLVHFVDKEDFIEIMEMLENGDLSSRGAKDLILFMMTEMPYDTMLEMSENDMSARQIAEMKGLIQKNDKDSLIAIIDTVIANNSKQYEELKSGNEKLIMFFVGQAMKEAKGSGNPQLFTEIIKEKIS